MEAGNQAKEKQAREEQKYQINILRSGNSKAIISVMKEIRKSGRASILPDIFDLMMVSEDEEVLKTCAELLCDIKVKEARNYLVDALEDDKYASIRKTITAACWQNDMDFSKHLGLFIDILLNDPYETAIEAFTVIENSLEKIEDSDRTKLVHELSSRSKVLDEQKQLLVKELIHSIKEY